MYTTDVINEAMDRLLSGEMSPADYIAVVRKVNEDLADSERKHQEELLSA